MTGQSQFIILLFRDIWRHCCKCISHRRNIFISLSICIKIYRSDTQLKITQQTSVYFEKIQTYTINITVTIQNYDDDDNDDDDDDNNNNNNNRLLKIK